MLTSEHTLLLSAAHQINPPSNYGNYATHLLQYIQIPQNTGLDYHAMESQLHCTPSSRGMMFLNQGTNDSSVHNCLEEIYSIGQKDHSIWAVAY